MTDATIRQCAILMGGLGTRLGDLAAATPKPLLDCGGRPFLAWLMREFIRFGVDDFVLLTGHLADMVEASLPALRAALPIHVRITCCREPVRAGTGGALFHARDHLAERFLLCNGDSMIDSNLARLLAAAAQDGADVTGRIILRQLADTSRYGVVQLDGDHIFQFAERPAPGTPGTINAGIYLFRRTILDHVTPSCSLEAEIMPRLAAAGSLRGTTARGWFIDIGIPADLARAQTELPHHLRRPALFLDRDGVINVDHGWVGTRERFEWVPGARESIAAASDAGVHVFVVTNQSGIARGHYTEAEFTALSAWMTNEIRAAGGTIDDMRHCPFHPDAPLDAFRQASPWRKPEPGMLLDLIHHWELEPARCALIGDQPSDAAAAAAAGIAAHHFAGGDLLALTRSVLTQLGR